jgi:hypothetical protein
MSQQFNAFYPMMEQNQLPKRDVFCRKKGDGNAQRRSL